MQTGKEENALKIFAERQLSDYLGSLKNRMTGELESENPNYLLNVNETHYVDHLAKKYHLEPLLLNFENLSVSDRRERIRADRFPAIDSAFFDPDERYDRQVITYHIPYSGDEQLLGCSPSPFVQWSIDVRLASIHAC